MNKFIPLLILLTIFFQCAERKKSNSNSSLLGGLLLLQNSSPCPGVASATAIGSVSRTEYSFTSCNSGTVTGFTSENISASSGITGTTANSRLASIATFGTEKVNIEVTFTLNSSGGYLDVIGLGLSSSASISGPGYRVSESGIKYFSLGGTPTAIATGVTPSTALNTQKTYCLELHKENGAHLFGWSKACAEVTNRASYEFDQESITTSTPGNNIGFVLSGSTLKKIIVSTGAIGTSGSLVSQ